MNFGPHDVPAALGSLALIFSACCALIAIALMIFVKRVVKRDVATAPNEERRVYLQAGMGQLVRFIRTMAHAAICFFVIYATLVVIYYRISPESGVWPTMF